MFLKRGRLSPLDLLLVVCLRGLEGRCSEAPLLESGLSPTRVPGATRSRGRGTALCSSTVKLMRLVSAFSSKGSLGRGALCSSKYEK